MTLEKLECLIKTTGIPSWSFFKDIEGNTKASSFLKNWSFDFPFTFPINSTEFSS